MQYHIVSHEELLKPRREPSIHSVQPEAGQRTEWPKASAGCLLSLAAAPTFAIMALVTGVLGGGPMDSLCLAGHGFPLSGMVPMYLLMSVFHSAPWLKLISSRQDA